MGVFLAKNEFLVQSSFHVMECTGWPKKVSHYQMIKKSY